MRKWTVVLLAVLTTLLVTLCSAAQVRPVQYVVHGNQQQIAEYERLMARFTQETGIPVHIIVTTGSQQNKWEHVITLVAGGVSPDVVGGVSVEFTEFAAKGLIRPLDDLISRDAVDMAGLVRPVADALTWQGRRYQLPYGVAVLTMFYNVERFNWAGLPSPPREWNTPEWTFDAFVETARRLTSYDAEGRPTQYGIAGPFWDSWITLPYPWGGRWLTEDLSTFLGTSDEVVASLQAFQDLVHQYRVMPTGNQVNNFISGQGAMAGLGTWNLVQLADSDQVWDFMPWFRVRQTAQAAINPIGYGILTTSPNPEGAWELIKWLTWNEQANLEYAIAAGAVPALVSNVPSWVAYWEQRLGRTVAAHVPVEQAGLYGAIVDIRRTPAFWSINSIMNQVAGDVINNRKPAHAE